MESLKKEFFSYLNEKLRSNLFTAWAVSWFIWNWKSIYVTFFISEKLILEKFQLTKLDYILNNFKDINHLLCYPIYSTLFLILILPIFNIGASSIKLLYKKLSNKILNNIDIERKFTYGEYKNLIKKSDEEIEEFREVLREKDTNLEAKTNELKKIQSAFQNYKRNQELINNIKSKYGYNDNQLMTILKNYLEYKNKEDEQKKEFEEIKAHLKSKYSQSLYLLNTLKEYLLEGKDVSSNNDLNELVKLFTHSQYIFKMAPNIYRFNEIGNKFYKYLIDEGVIKNT